MVFPAAGGVLSSIKTPYSVFCINVVVRNLIVMVHHMAVFVLVAVLFVVDLNGWQILFIPGVMIFALTGTWVSILIGMFCTRWRDIIPPLTNILQITTFISPIFWPVEQLGDRAISIIIVYLNPFYHFVEIIRAPLLGKVPEPSTYLATIIITILGWGLTFWLFSKYRKRIIYWI